MKIPIVILNWNGLEDTLECMSSIEKQSYPNYKIYLVDNGSNGDDAQILDQTFRSKEWVKLIKNKENLGFTKGNNEVLQKYILTNPDYKYVLLLNNDTVLDKDWIAELVNSAEKNKAHIVSSKMVNYFDHSRMDNAGHQMLNTGEIIPIGFNESVDQYNSTFDNMGACAGAALYDVDMLRKIGVFDPYFSTGYEDAEIGVRANVLGYKTIFEPKAIIYHKISQSVSKIRDYSYIRQIQINTYYSYFKLMPVGVILINLPSILFKTISILTISLLTFRKKLLQILINAKYIIFFKEWKKIMSSRNRFFAEQCPIQNWCILRKLRFFLLFDIYRFYKFILFKKKTTFENW